MPWLIKTPQPYTFSVMTRAAMASSNFRKPTFVLCVALLCLLSSPVSLVSGRWGKSCHGFRTAFSFSDFSSDVQKLTLSGDAKLLGSDLQISGSSAFSSGGVFYSQPVRFLNPFRKGESKSFSSFFSFSMDSNKGSGIAFVIAPSKVFAGRNGPWLGLSDKPADLAHTVAIEFDTSMDAAVHDPNGNHVGFDLGSLVSLATAEVSDGFSLKSDEKLYAWIDYMAPSKVLEVRLSRSAAERPKAPILSYNIDLADVFQQEMFVGFSSSTGDTPQSHVIYSWSFITRNLGMGKDFFRSHPEIFGPHEGRGHGPHNWHHGPYDWHHGPHDSHHGPRDWQHGPDDLHHGHGGWHHEGFPYLPGHDGHNEWHHDHLHPRTEEDEWFGNLNDVWGVIISLLFGAACGTVAAGVILGVWFLIRKHFMGASSDAKQGGGILFGYQKLTAPISDVKGDANGYQKLSTTDPDGKTESV